MAEAYIALPPDSTGKQLRTQTGGPNASHMEVHVLADSDGTLAQVSTLAKDATLTNGTARVGQAGANPWDCSSNDNVVTGSVTVADTGSTSAAGQGGQTLWAGTPTTGSTVALSFPVFNTTPESQSNVVIFVSGTFAGTYVLERSPDNGTTWTSFNCFIAGTADQISTGTLQGMFHGNVAGTTAVRVRFTALASGSPSVRLTSGIGTGTITVGNPLRLYDGASKTQASIKPASTAAAFTDSALVVTNRDVNGTWGYKAGASGTPALPAGARVQSIVAHATTAGSLTINGGDSIPVPANVGFTAAPQGALVAPTIAFTGTDSYFVEYVI
ncbi:MAG: hypothetical protein ACXVGE_13010 [Blastococcus sp.]